MRPKLKFAIDVRVDISNAKWFVKNGEFLDWFLPSDLEYLTHQGISPSKRNAILTKYTKDTHKINQKDILKGVKDTKKRWTKIESKFYKIVDQIFQGHAWPKGKYIGYASVYLMFPRDISAKTFFFPYSKDRWDPIATIAHEMLHFMFYDYIEKNYGIKGNGKLRGKDPKYVWQVSETFNTVIENWTPYKKIFNVTKNIKPYPGCEKMYAAMTKQWAKNPDIEVFLDKWLAFS